MTRPKFNSRRRDQAEMQLPTVHSEQPSSAAEELLRRASSLPPAPLVSLKLWRLLHEEEARRGEVAELVRYDARLCGLILRLANSAMYGGRGVRSIDQAVLALGAKAVGDAVFVLIGKEFLAAPNGNYRDRVRVWRHSVTAAVAAAHLAAHTTRFRVDPGTAYTAGLLHDIGTSVIAHSGHPELPTLIAFQSEERCSWAEAEGAVLGTITPSSAACSCSRGSCRRTWSAP
jgi:HD-like signal output (HDOD) protein